MVKYRSIGPIDISAVKFRTSRRDGPGRRDRITVPRYWQAAFALRRISNWSMWRMHVDPLRNLLAKGLTTLLSCAGVVERQGEDHWARRVAGPSNDGFNAIVTDQFDNSYDG